MKCIYCLKDKSLSNFQKREHVMPQCFGRYSPDNLILYKCVCDDCNQYFGDKLELFLGRDSYESLERKRHGIDPKKTLKNKRRVKSKIADGEWKGVIVEDVKGDKPGEIGLRNSIQAGFFNKFIDGYMYYEPKDIPTAEKLKKEGCDLKKIILIFGDDTEFQRLKEIFQDKGIEVPSKSELIQPNRPKGKIVVESDITIDKTIFRAISKIAFNYFAFVVGSEISSRDWFDEIRRFIRYGEGDPKKFFAVNIPPILFEDQKLEKFSAKITQGHLVNVEWKNDAIISKVSPFNNNTYGIVLCKNFKGIWFPLKSGHHFDIKTKTVSKLLSVSNRIVV